MKSFKKLILLQLIFLQFSINIIAPISISAEEIESTQTNEPAVENQSEQSSSDEKPAEGNQDSPSSNSNQENQTDENEANSSETNSEEGSSSGDTQKPEESQEEFIEPESNLDSDPNPSPTPSSDPESKNENPAVNDFSASSSTPSATLELENELSPSLESSHSGEVDLATGDATSSAVAITKVNTTQVNSQLSVNETNISSTSNSLMVGENFAQNNSFDDSLSPQASSGGKVKQSISIDNSATVSSQVSAESNTGNNCQEVDSGDIGMKTGDALSSATSIAVINSSLVDSTANFDVVNIFNDFFGDLILTNPHYFEETYKNALSKCNQECWNKIDVVNTAVVNNQVSAVATSGGNIQQVASSSGVTSLDLDTGDATAKAVAQVDLNTTYLNYIYYSLMINNLSNWQGAIYGWDNPGSVSYADRSQILDYLSNRSQMMENRNQAVDREIDISNQAEVVIKTSAISNTGQNTQLLENGSAKMETGNARSVASSYLLANSTVLNSHLQRTYLNILGDWRGDLVFAYPDLEVRFSQAPNEVERGSQANYLIEVVNKGLLTARDVVISQRLPSILGFVSQSFDQVVKINDTLIWKIGDLAPQQSVSFFVNTILAADLSKDANSFVSSVSVSSRDLESTGNNYAKAESFVFYPANNSGVSVINKSVAIANSSDGENEGDPQISIEAKNNVNDFVYPGDSVIFELNLENKGGNSYQTTIYTLLVSKEGEILGGGNIFLDKVSNEETIKMSFQMALPKDANPGEYQLITWADGVNYFDQGYQTDEVISEFLVQAKNGYYPDSTTLDSVKESVASSSEQVLGVTDQASANNGEFPSRSPIRALSLLPLLALEFIIRRLKQSFF